MGKKSKFKKIRRMAEQLPDVMLGVKTTVTPIKGCEIINSGTTQLDNGIVVDADKIYKKVNKEPAPLNHNRNMKKIYNKSGHNGVNAYVKSVINFNKMEKQAAELKKNQEENIMEEINSNESNQG